MINSVAKRVNQENNITRKANESNSSQVIELKL